MHCSENGRAIASKVLACVFYQQRDQQRDQQRRTASLGRRYLVLSGQSSLGLRLDVRVICRADLDKACQFGAFGQTIRPIP